MQYWKPCQFVCVCTDIHVCSKIHIYMYIYSYMSIHVYTYRVAKIHWTPEVAGHFSQKSH